MNILYLFKVESYVLKDALCAVCLICLITISPVVSEKKTFNFCQEIFPISLLSPQGKGLGLQLKKKTNLKLLHPRIL